jgi:hypothetical protein
MHDHLNGIGGPKIQGTPRITAQGASTEAETESTPEGNLMTRTSA